MKDDNKIGEIVYFDLSKLTDENFWKEILNNSGLTIISADDLNDAAKKIVEAIK